MVARTFGSTLCGVDGVIVQIEVARENAVPKILMTGLAGEIVRESRERVRVCLSNLGFDVPKSRILVHLSPADARKQGSQFDLGIALGILCAEECIDARQISHTGFLGELGLDGKVRGIHGALALAQALVNDERLEMVLVPRENGDEVALLRSKKIRLVDHLVGVIEYLEGTRELDVIKVAEDFVADDSTPSRADLDYVVGHPVAKRALQIALAGRHHLLLMGPPGVGKSMLAQCAPSLLPPLCFEELVEVAKNHGSAKTNWLASRHRPFRAPHHSISAAGLLGGGSGIVLPGEVTLAHFGVLFLDEFPEYRRDVLEGLREPMQSGVIHLNRVGHSLSLPARFLLIAAMNPCPCGFAFSTVKRCGCLWDRVAAYRKRISGPILDRFDLGSILSAPSSESHGTWKHKEFKSSIASAHRRQQERYGPGCLNGDLVLDFEREQQKLAPDAQLWFNQVREKGRLSFRALQKLLKVSRTVADLAGENDVRQPHLQEAWSLRCPDLHALSS